MQSSGDSERLDFSDFLEGADPGERLNLEKILGRTLLDTEARSEPRLIRPVLPIEDWVDSEYHLGPDAVNIYDYWKECLIDVFKTPNRFNEVIVDGAIGVGKTTFAELCMLRKIYELSCYENIHALFGLMRKAPIVFFYFSVSRAQAEMTGFGDLRSFVDSSPYFLEEFPRNSDLNSVLVWPDEKLMVLSGSRMSHSIGMNMMGSIMDEANYMQGEQDVSTVEQLEFSRAANLYTNSRQRARSRFLGFGTDHSLSLLVSSSTHQTSFTETRKRASFEDSTVKVITARLWDVKKPGTYSDKKFWIFTGSGLLEPFIVYSVADVNQFLESVGYLPVSLDWEVWEVMEALPFEYKPHFVSISESFRKDFEGDLISALQSVAGVSVAPLGKLFTARPILARMCQEGERRGAVHPFTRRSLILSTGDTGRVEDFLKAGFKFPHPSRKRYVHIDQSVSGDNTGISMVHIDSVTYEDGAPKVRVRTDFMLQIEPPRPPRKISIMKLREFLFYLRDIHHITFGKVTYDSFASEESLQILAEQGIPSGLQSVDRTDAAYLALVSLLFEERLYLYTYPPFEDELLGLVHNRVKRKVDHSVTGTKDVADSLAGAVFNALCAPLTEFNREQNLSALLTVNAEDNNRKEGAGAGAVFSVSDLLRG